MRFGFINSKNIEKLKKNIALVTASTLMLTMVSSCGKKNEKNDNKKNIVIVDDIDYTDSVVDTNINNNNENNIKYTVDDWNMFVNNAWNSVSGKINNIDKKGFNSALLIFNIDFLKDNNPEILVSYYGKGIDVENELNKAYIVLSQIREYNTSLNSTENLYLFNDLLISNGDDSAIVSLLNSYLRETITLSADISNESNLARVREIFDTVKKFSLGQGTIKTTVGNKSTETYQVELTKGGILASENIIQCISVYCQNVIPYEERVELDNSLRTKDVLAKIQEVMATYNGIASVTNSSLDDEVSNEIVNTIKSNCNLIYDELSRIINITKAEVDALYTIANIDYLMDSANSRNAFKLLYSNGFDINKTFEDAESAISKIELYNRSQNNINDIYDYGHFYLNSKTNIISTKVIAETSYNLSRKDANLVSSNLNFLKYYTQYNSDVTINYSEGNQIIKLDKNALNKGGNQVVDLITYYALINNKSNINNDEIVNYMISLVDGTTIGFNPYADIVLMVEDYCQINNIEVYDYKVGEKQKVLKKDAK